METHHSRDTRNGPLISTRIVHYAGLMGGHSLIVIVPAYNAYNEEVLSNRPSRRFIEHFRMLARATTHVAVAASSDQERTAETMAGSPASSKGYRTGAFSW